MTSSFIGWDPHGFWVHDQLFQMWIYKLAELLSKMPNERSRAYAARLRESALVPMPGCIDIELEEQPPDVWDDIREQAALVCGEMERDPSFLEAESLNRLQIGGAGIVYFAAIPLSDMPIRCSISSRTRNQNRIPRDNLPPRGRKQAD